MVRLRRVNAGLTLTPALPIASREYARWERQMKMLLAAQHNKVCAFVKVKPPAIAQ